MNTIIISREGRRRRGDLVECTKCHHFLPESDFKKCNKVACGLDPNCNRCHRKRGKAYRSKPEVKQHNKDKHDRWYSKNKTSRLATMKSYLAELRAKVIAAYGGKCECCGEDYPEFLAIDHRNGDGKSDRRRGLIGRAMYLYLIHSGFPQDKYRLLCHNCNMAFGLYGYCPHHREKEAR